VKSSSGKQKKIYYLLPLRWSLHYIMAPKEWQDFRNRVKKLDPNWDKCSCPKRCKANSLDEWWEYDNSRHIKRFVKAKFICSGCHWLKTIPWRIETWLRVAAGKLLPPSKPPHIIDCLGWTEAQVEKLREKDMKQHLRESQEMDKIQKEVEAGEAEILTWIVDLSDMKQYGYSEQEIATYEDGMKR
jgi:hypothetical protein